MSSPIYVAIDTPDLDRAKQLAKAVAPVAGGLKLGLEFFCHNGRAGVAELADFGLPIFLDLKLHDIPNTVAKAIQALGALAPAVLTVHAAGGRAMMEDAKAAASAGTKVVAVTVLTSLDRGDLGADRRRPATAKRRSNASPRSPAPPGSTGSSARAMNWRSRAQAWKDGFFVVPGIRPANRRSATRSA